MAYKAVSLTRKLVEKLMKTRSRALGTYFELTGIASGLLLDLTEI